LWQLLPEDGRPNEVWLLLTAEAERECGELIESDAAALGLQVKKILIDSATSDDTNVFLEGAAREIPSGCLLTLDVTQGLRHHAFLFYALAIYLGEFRGIRIHGAWYCRIETAEQDTPKPVIDLMPVLTLAKWFHALAVFRETGSLNAISKLMDNGELRSLVERLSFFFLNGMPLEAGDAATRLIGAAETTPLTAGVPLAHELQSWLLAEVTPLAGPTLSGDSQKARQSWKRAILLTEQELERQAVFIHRYFHSGQLNLAFGLLREWIINHVAAESNTERWLERSAREILEHSLGGLGEVYKSKDPGDPVKKRYRHQRVRDRLSEVQRKWAKRWNTVCDLRNKLQHHGMKVEALDPDRQDIRDAEAEFDDRANWGPLGTFGGGAGRLLICPIGLTPGVLFSAVSRVRPDRVIVICSDQSVAAISEALTHSSHQVEIHRLTMVDPYCGIAEFGSLIDCASLWLFESDEIHVNLTGGTTLMGVLAGELVKRASREYQRPTREFVLIDKRPPAQQQDDPWQLGDIHYLDGHPPVGRPESTDERKRTSL